MTFQLGDMVTIPALSSYKRGMVVSKPSPHPSSRGHEVVRVLWFGQDTAHDTDLRHLVKVEV